MNSLSTTGRLISAAVLGLMLIGLALPATVSAHPLGNFTINRYNGLTVASEWTFLDRVVDLAELPTVRARQAIDTDRDGTTSANETAAWAEAQCASASGELSLRVNDQPAQFMARGVGITSPSGQAGLPTLRLVCTYVAAHPATAAGTQIQFADSSYAGRQGWQEIVITPAGLTLGGADAFASGSSDRLRVYPADGAGAIRAQASATFIVSGTSSAAPVAQPTVADAVALGSAPSAIVGASAVAGPAQLPGGVADLPAELAAVFQAQELSLPAILVAVMAAMVVGAFHAATPGHGKTLMAAYLVGSRGTTRHALGLGMTVTVAHTVGVLVLGAIVLAAGAAVPAERLFPVLGLVSGLIVTALGATFLYQRIRAARADRAHGHDHAAGHEHSHAEHDEHSHAEEAKAAAEGWHSHGPLRHTHLPATDGPLRRRNLLALGLIGGLVPSASAILILVGSIAAGRPAFGMLLIVAFGAGMAAVLVGVGVLLVRARSLAERLPSRSLNRVFAYAPLVTALTFLVVGAAITIQAGSQLQ